MEKLKKDIYKWFDSELCIIIEKDRKEYFNKILKDNISRIRKDAKDYYKENRINYKNYINKETEKCKQNNIKEIEKSIIIHKTSLKKNIDSILHHIKYFTNDEIFEYAKQKRTENLNYSGGEYYVIIFEFILDFIKKNSSIEQPKIEQKENDKIPAKFYALYHCLLIEIGTEKPFERNLDDKYSRKEIEAFAKNRYKGISAQGFYRAFIDIDLTDKIRIAKFFGKGYKEKLIIISNKSAELMKHLDKYPN